MNCGLNLCVSFADISKPKIVAQTKYVHGVSTDPLSDTRIASFSEVRQLIPLTLSLLVTTFYTYSKGGSGSVVDCLTRDQGATGSASPASLCCVLEQDTLIVA